MSGFALLLVGLVVGATPEYFASSLVVVVLASLVVFDRGDCGGF